MHKEIDTWTFYCGSEKVGQNLRRESSNCELPEEEASLLGLLHQVECMCGPSEVRCTVHDQECDVVHQLYLLPMNEKRGVLHPPRSPEVHNDLLGLGGVQDKVAVVFSRYL